MFKSPLCRSDFVFVILAIACVALSDFSWGQEEATANVASSAPLRVLTYNIHHGRGGDGEVDLARIAEVIKDSRADVVALQEVDNGTLRTGRVDQTEELASRVGMTGVFVHHIDFEGGKYGQAILSKFPISNLQQHWLPGSPDRERRMAGSVTIDLGSQTLMFVTTHLHHANESIRNLQAVHLNKIFTSADIAEPIVVLAGDFNATPDSRTMQILGQQWSSATAGNSDALTFPADSAERQLDYVLFYPKDKVKVVEASVIDETQASDHRPVVVEMLFQD